MQIRTTAPSTTDKHWINTAYGGLNECINILNGSVLANCVGYAWGRAYEVLAVRPNLPMTNANTWYGKYTGKKGQTPKVGSILCLDDGKYGHVAFVEKVNSDGSIDISQSVYGGARFEYKKGIKPPYNIYNGYKLQGFLYLDIPEEKKKASFNSRPILTDVSMGAGSGIENIGLVIHCESLNASDTDVYLRNVENGDLFSTNNDSLRVKYEVTGKTINCIFKASLLGKGKYLIGVMLDNNIEIINDVTYEGTKYDKMQLVEDNPKMNIIFEDVATNNYRVYVEVL